MRFSLLNIFSIGLLVSACSDTTLKGGFTKSPTSIKRQSAEQASAKDAQDSSGESLTTGTTENFQTSGSAGKVDIAWFIDQSGSMKDEIDNVKENFGSFIESVNALVDARIALVAKSSGENSIAVTQVADKIIQVDQKVTSNDALEIAISTFVPVSGALPSEVKDQSDAKSKLADFFRADVPAVIVIVTDDDAANVTSSNFEELSKATLGKVPKLFAFRATEASKFEGVDGCSLVEQGISYEELASNTGGEVFDICEPDWTQKFEKLKQGIAKAAQNSFQLKKVPTKITEVKVNGAVLNETGYSLTGNLITIASGAIPPTSNVSVEVSYQ
ncbi:MAG: hypothetical protein RJB13_1101 [Pseudomonadota bacterium]